MKLASFVYTDTKGKITNREVFVTGMPTNKLNGIDVSELSAEDQALFSFQYDMLLEDFHKQVDDLQKRFDVTHNFRQFLESRIQDLRVEDI
jgi:hypothetical protein